MFQASYLGAFNDAELVGVIAHCWNGMILMQSPDLYILDNLYRALLTLRTVVARGIKGASEDYQQVRFIIDCLKPDARLVQMNTREGLFALDLTDLKIPLLIQTGKVICRRIEERDLTTLLPWRFDYSVEALGASRENIKEDEEQAFLRSYLENGHGFVLEEAKTRRLLSTTAFNAALPDVVQIGTVWTPPELRGRGYARAVVAGQLLFARDEGVKEANLFAENAAEIRVYEAVGFQKIGDFGITLLKEPWFAEGSRRRSRISRH
jgi:RimJ/RimL family protein N-acetyltransferase